MNKEPLPLTPANLGEWHLLIGYCGQCGHEAPIDPRRLPQDRPLETIESELRCTSCGNRLGNYIEIGPVPVR